MIMQGIITKNSITTCIYTDERRVKKLLIIDDGRLLCFGLKRALHQDELEVDTAPSVNEAITKLGSNEYDVCLVDIRFPDENGFKVMKHVRDHWPDIKIILMSANDITFYDNLPEIIDKARANGACHILCNCLLYTSDAADE
mgnify:CR=1 FL=1